MLQLFISPDWIAFIHDDEVAPPDWIARLHTVAVHYGADVTSGWVVQVETAAEAEIGAQSWKVPTAFGEARDRPACPTANVIFRSWIASEPLSLRFDEAMRHGGSDSEYFMRAHQRGRGLLVSEMLRCMKNIRQSVERSGINACDLSESVRRRITDTGKILAVGGVRLPLLLVPSISLDRPHSAP